MSNEQPRQLALENVSCDLCGVNDATLIMVAGDQRYNLPGRFQLVRCRCCGLVYLNPRPTQDSLKRYYPQNYRPHLRDIKQHQNRLGAAVRKVAFFPQAGAWAHALGWLYNSTAYRAFLPAETWPGRVLDVGCGPGDYLRVWQDLGWEVEGLEPNPEVARRAESLLGAKVRAGDIEDSDLPKETFDVVTMCHVLEHTRSPSKALHRISSALKHTGRLVLMVPNFSSWIRKLAGNSWHGLEVPRHLYHFEPGTLHHLLNHKGYRIEQMSGTAHPDVLVRSLRRMLNLKGDDTVPTAAERVVGMALLLPLAAIRRSSSLWVVARRRTACVDGH